MIANSPFIIVLAWMTALVTRRRCSWPVPSRTIYIYILRRKCERTARRPGIFPQRPDYPTSATPTRPWWPSRLYLPSRIMTSRRRDDYQKQRVTRGLKKYTLKNFSSLFSWPIYKYSHMNWYPFFYWWRQDSKITALMKLVLRAMFTNV